jgi:hypothetical protein
MIRRASLAGLFGLLLAWAQWEELGPPKDAAILELSTEPRLPARIYLYKDGAEFRLTPVDAVLPIRGDTFYRDTYYSKTPDPATMEVVAADQYHYLLLKGTGRFYLPPGKYRVDAYRGLFYTPARVEFELTRGQTSRVAIPLQAWTDPSAWISADDHIHLTRARKHDPVYLNWLAAEDLTVGNFLELQRQMHAAVQYGFGRAAEARKGGYAIRSGHESRNEFWGHINILGPERMIEPLSTGTMYANSPESYPFPGLLFAAGRKAGGVVGYAHFFERPQHSAIYLDAALGNIDFVEVFQFGVLKTKPWYELLNAGVRVTGIAGSDFPVPFSGRKPWPHWIPLLGPERALVKARPGENSYDAWARGVREGRVVVSNGPVVELDMSGNHATAKASFFRPLETVEIVRNGVVVASGAGPVVTATIDDSASCWVAARVRARNEKGEPELWGHTNPAYLLRGGEPVREPAARASVAAKWADQLAAFRAAGIRFPDEAKRREFFDLAERALAELRR